jgi:hypothetical protein
MTTTGTDVEVLLTEVLTEEEEEVEAVILKFAVITSEVCAVEEAHADFRTVVTPAPGAAPDLAPIAVDLEAVLVLVLEGVVKAPFEAAVKRGLMRLTVVLIVKSGPHTELRAWDNHLVSCEHFHIIL